MKMNESELTQSGSRISSLPSWFQLSQKQHTPDSLFASDVVLFLDQAQWKMEEGETAKHTYSRNATCDRLQQRGVTIPAQAAAPSVRFSAKQRGRVFKT